ncbi:MAG: dihydrodipicolinate reductase [Planctomycetota bacterium]|nr:dihydrodipicolinate reductase [Planctomycetota bacterium]
MRRILHVGVGPLGQRILEDLHERGLGQVIGVVDSAPALRGKSLADVVPRADHRLHVLPDLEAFDDWNRLDAAIVTTRSDLPSCMDTFRELLARGVAVVSTCEELVYPWLRHVALAEELQDLARRTGGRILGTGVNPGFLMDALPTFMTGVSRSVRSITCHRVQDASSRRVPFQQKIGAGLDDAQFAARVREGVLRHVGLGESMHFIAHYTGLRIERWEEDIQPVHATRDLVCALGPIPKGRCAGVRQTARAYADEREILHLEFQAAIGQPDPHDSIRIHGEPEIHVTIPGGVHGDIATSAITLNALPSLLASPPGLHTMATIPMPAHLPRLSIS